MLLQEILSYNEQFVENKEYVPYEATKMPQKRMVVVSCMDARLVELLPKALDLHNGDAKILKTAGGTITHPFGSIMRSIVTAVYELNADEIYIIGHHACGMSQSNPKGTLQKILDRGVASPEILSAIEYAGIDLEKWLFGFDNVEDSIQANINLVKNHPLIPKDVPVHGLVIDPHTGKLDLLVDGYKALNGVKN
ncbi:beta-class carbonic anhydrase [Neobacillus massiliamazoniensis]|uniref:carbonic anhydrase n=1 Tax=Neobacillus massiliamazoniensis TaxID=1499688 RepID=A0A0U1NZF0_9BACI|nr:carbonic anhydrase [Neobacillus massiliamazoniensis]CRK83400.1 carbonate dehydratase [Neobacillus massiliamazoniensis]